MRATGPRLLLDWVYDYVGEVYVLNLNDVALHLLTLGIKTVQIFSDRIRDRIRLEGF
jgi:hypothetical protein